MIATPTSFLTRVLVVEDHAATAAALQASLEIAGYAAHVAHDAREALRLATATRMDLVLLDLGLPDLDGLQLLRQLRARGVAAPVLVLSARDAETDKVRAFQQGADGYLAKPCGMLELLARVEALLRRSAATGGAAVAGARGRGPDLVIGDLELYVAEREVRKRGVPVPLTYKEYELLLALARRQGAAVTREALVETVWGDPGEPIETRTIDTHIRALRRKLEDLPARPRRILTVWKVGYRVDM